MNWQTRIGGRLESGNRVCAGMGNGHWGIRVRMWQIYDVFATPAVSLTAVAFHNCSTVQDTREAVGMRL